MTKLTRRQLGTLMVSAALAPAINSEEAMAQDASPDERAKAVEQQMTDDERFSLLVSLIGAVPLIGVPRDMRIPPEVDNISAGYTPGIPRVGVPALQSSDASMGIAAGRHRVAVGKSAEILVLIGEAQLNARLFGS